MSGSSPLTSTPQIAGQALSLGYDDRAVVDALDFEVPVGEFTVIVGPNACGKSTLLKGLARLLKPSSGCVLVDGQDIHRMRTVDVATRIGLLPQQNVVPSGITVTDLVARGRFAHQRFFRRWSPQDAAAVAAAMAATRITALADRVVDQLSGGQRQRVWLATVLAQDTPVVFLDEPTTYLDIAHQVEVLELCRELHQAGHTLVAVLHDLNQAARYATHLVAMRDGRIVAEGAPAAVLTEQLLEEVFGLPARIIDDPFSGAPLVIPTGAPRWDDHA
ncbi:ABC transporter ATP-binding protein [Austwickia chelonae]|uniref:ABC transporter ATP-binding protein n=1 Tax=Austwickia chelonae TaxID=100225 RepID=UPI000E27D81A|nr:ABC transporter ATP-binding protein [Austwickia chelonae]